jgi:hypothetical protein
MKTTRQVLKADQVACEGPLQLSLDPTALPAGHKPRSVATGPSVRIAQNHAQYAVIEVTCRCGGTTYIRCDYAAATIPAAAENPISS